MDSEPRADGNSGVIGWVHKATVAQLTALAALFGLAVWIINSGLDLLWAINNGVTIVAMSSADAVLSMISGVLLLQLMLAHRRRQRKLIERLATIAEMNHHVRNALDIQLTAYLTHDRQLIDEIRTSVQHIEWTLREILPKTVDTTDSKYEP